VLQPVLVCCEAFKFHERVQLDSITHNELGDPDALAHVPAFAPGAAAAAHGTPTGESADDVTITLGDVWQWTRSAQPQELWLFVMDALACVACPHCSNSNSRRMCQLTQLPRCMALSVGKDVTEYVMALLLQPFTDLVIERIYAPEPCIGPGIW
jgi:hypothetical protein